MASQCDSLQSSSSSPYANGEFAGCGGDLCWPEMRSSEVFVQLPLDSDFYCESDDGVRGVTLDLDSDMTSFCTAFVGYDEDGSAKACLKQSPTRQFTGRAAPRQLPDDDLEVTSVTVDPRATAADVCNILHAYTTSEVTASSVKINPEKYTIKAAMALSAMAVVNASVAAYLYSTLSILPTLHRLQEYVLACASTRRTETFAFCV